MEEIFSKEGEIYMVGKKILVINKRVRYEYFIEEIYECGIELKGIEVKLIR